MDHLFCFLVQVACIVRLERPEMDGSAFWKPIKDIVEKLDEFPVEWKKNITIAFRDNFSENDQIAHFKEQLVRIPQEDKATLRRVLQIALNIGQYEALANTRLNLRLSDFLWNYDILVLNSLLSKRSEIGREIRNYLSNYVI
jgi:hypothetical protein